jgi:succinate dehydrogenase/fumarate reductase flavoprotein subunit
VDRDGVEREFLYDALGESAYGYVFLKGYQWPFDTRRLEGSSQIDLLVAGEIKSGRRVFMDFTRDPEGFSLEALPDEAKDYLTRSGATYCRPIDRLDILNRGAIELYADHGIDLRTQPLEIAVCAQHCNGGVAVDGHWQSSIEGLYAVGEAAGTFGVYRPGGSALNSTQVGAIRAAEHIAARSGGGSEGRPEYELPRIRYGESNIAELLDLLQSKMSQAADFERSTQAMREHLEYLTSLHESFFSVARIESEREIAELFKLYDTVLTQRATLSAMLTSAQSIGTHGAAIVDGKRGGEQTQRDTRTLTRGFVSRIERVSPMPEPELWFETLLARQRGDKNGK